jgi:hypothetical protein
LNRERLIAVAEVVHSEDGYGLSLIRITEDTSSDDLLRERLDERLAIQEKMSEKKVGEQIAITIEKSVIF